MNKTITQEEIEKATVEYAASLSECGMYDKETPATKEDIEYAFKAGVKFALGKQEKDAEDTVIQGWVARDANGSLYAYCIKPERNVVLQVWVGRYADFDMHDSLLPDLTWNDDPIEVELIIKRKKK